MSLVPKTRLGPYEVLGPLKAGGMGEVYRARDTQLDRDVALKVLRADLVGDGSAISRFQREARLAGGLNHPHIISIFGVHEVDGLLCIAMELIDGETLERWQKEHKPSLGRLLDVFIQIADALGAAHGANVIHRDIKPSNVLVNPQGYVKVLDFGLAKQMITQGELSHASTDVISGAMDVLGTPAYMSPEQAAGSPVDARTDVFSMGVMLYEAVTGVRPFAGDSVVQILNEVITKEPRSAVEVNPSLPAEIQWILERSMAKRPQDRYSSMADLASDLRRVRGKLQDESGHIRPFSFRPSVRRLVAASVLVVLAGSVAWLYRGNRPKERASVRYEQLTDFNDSAISPSLSPDGRMVTFIRGGTFGGSASYHGEIYVKLLPDGEPIQLTRDGYGKFMPAFTPDGTAIVYTRIDKGFSWDSWQVPVLGGTTTPYLPNASGLVFIGKDEILFSEISNNPHMGLMTSRLNRIGQRMIYMPPGAGDMAHRAALSPDRKWLLVVEMDGAGWLPCRLLPFDGSSTGRQVGPPNSQCTTAAWSPNGRWMYFSSNAGGAFHIWRQAFPDGQPEQITAESNEQEGTAVAPDGRSMITSVGTGQGTIWMRDRKGERQLTNTGMAILPRLTPDGRTVFYQQRTGASRSYVSAELWKMDLETERKERVLPGFLISHYDISRDGKQLLFAAAEGTESPGIWIADIDRRRPPRQLTRKGEFRAYFVGQDEILYMSNDRERFLYRMRTDGSGASRVNDVLVTQLINVSPDGEWAAVTSSQSAEADKNAVWLFALRRQIPPVTLCTDCRAGFGPGRQDAPLIAWSYDGNSVFISLKFFGLQSRKTVVLPFNTVSPRFDLNARTEAEFGTLPGARIIEERDVFPALRPGEYLMSRRTASANLFRISLPE